MDLGAWVNSPLHAPIARWLTRLAPERFPAVEELNGLVQSVPALPAGFRFGRAGGPLAAAEYERGIASTGVVPIRPNDWHDLFNALAWLSFPRLKASLNRCHVAALSANPSHEALKGQRGALRDLATLLDESGMLLACDDRSLVEALAAHAWRTLLVERRAAVCRSMRFAVCGHAIFDRGRAARKGLTARVLVLPVDQTHFGGDDVALLPWLDAMAAGWLDRVVGHWRAGGVDAHEGPTNDAAGPDPVMQDPSSARPGAGAAPGTRLLLHLPVMGIPGWCAANADPAFYDDPQVFRRAAIAP